MTGLIKAKKYDWKDSNLALFGSDTEKQVKKESAQTEAAWEGAGQEVGLQIWRIVKFEVTSWPKEDYGSFYSGDSYIILNTYKPNPDSEELAYDVHFWIGKYSTQDEYGTAAYKTVELDTYLDDIPVQHREVMGHESALFKSYFPRGVVTMEGGAETGFRHVTPEEYRPRLLHFHGQRKNIVIREIPLVRSRMTSNDVYILDLGLELYQWNGSGSNKDERFRALQFVQQLRSDRNGRPDVETLEEDSLYEEHKFYQALTGEDDEDEDQVDGPGTPKLFRVSDEDGSLDMELVKEGELGMGDLESKDVFVVDLGSECFVWVGSGSSQGEKKNAMAYAHKYLTGSEHPLIPISIFGQGHEDESFKTALAA